MKRRGRKRISLILTLGMLMGLLLPLIITKDVHAGEEWNDLTIYVQGIQIWNGNKDDVLGDGGSVSYDTSTQTLTLNNANISGGVVSDYTFAGIYVTNSQTCPYRDLTIKVVGNNKIRVGDDPMRACNGIGARVGLNFTFTGNGSLDILTGNGGSDYNSNGGGSYCVLAGDVTFLSGYYNFVCSRSGDKSAGINSHGNLTVYGGEIICYDNNASGNSSYGLLCLKDIRFYGGDLYIRGTRRAICQTTGGQDIHFDYPVNVTLSNNYNGTEAYKWNTYLLLSNENIKNIRIKADNPFLSDVQPKEYYYNAVLWAYYRNPQITTGVSSTRFDPKGACTRGQVVTFLYRYVCNPVVNLSVEDLTFKDVPESAYEKYYFFPVYWAKENGITSGINPPANDLFAPSQACTRAQFVTFLWRFAGCPGHTVENPFTDVKESSAYYNAILWAYEQGITTGTSDTTFSPSKTVKRCEVLTFLYRYNSIGVG